MKIKRKIGLNRGRARVWLEKRVLSENGWKHGDRFDCVFSDGAVTYTKSETGARRVAGSVARPVVDTCTDKIRESVGAGESVEVVASPGRIILKVLALLVAAGVTFGFLPSAMPSVLVACEFSGTVRDQFSRAGWHAVSADLLESETVGHHIKGDVSAELARGWDMILAFPPCTFLCSSGLWRSNPKHDPSGKRARKTEAALDFVRLILAAPSPQIAVENPRGCISTRIRPASQYVQPYNFGHDASKNTGLWLKGLPNLTGTAEVAPRWVGGLPRWGNQTDSGQNNIPPSADRWKLRSKTFAGVAAAMAAQWLPAEGEDRLRPAPGLVSVPVGPVQGDLFAA